MRKFNSILTAVILVLFIIHGILGALNMLDVVVVITKVMAWVMVALIAVHVVLSCILTAKAIKTWKVTGAPYLRENTLFWARRISGIADLIVDRSIMFENLKSIGLWPEKEARHTKRGEEIAYEASRCLQCGCGNPNRL